MPAWLTTSALYKGLLCLVLALIAIEYLFGSIIETRRWEIFTFNVTRPQDRGVQGIHSPLLAKLIHNFSDTRAPSRASTPPNPKLNSSIAVNSTNLVISSPEANLSASVSEVLESSSELPLVTTFPTCPEIPPSSRGKIPIVKTPVPTLTELEKRFSWLKSGGHWEPESCRAESRVALIVPFRCRGEHLLLFLQHMHPFLKSQQISYTIFIIEQDGFSPFNRAMLMNIGYKEASKQENFDCYIFHDVDLLPEDDRNIYTCPTEPRHMSVAVDVFDYKLPYSTIFGGVSAISKEHFKLLNGFSNKFWGWGGEDDDMSNRIRFHNLHIARYPASIARYTMLTHKKDTPSPTRYDVLKAGTKRYDTDGLNSLKYSVVMMKKKVLYTWLLVQVEKPS